MNKKLTASLCAILVLLAGCSKKVDPDLEVSPENAPVVVATGEQLDVASANGDKPAPVEAPKPVEKRLQVTVLPTKNPCWVKIDKAFVNVSNLNKMYGRHAVDEYGIILAPAEVHNEETRIFIPTDNPEAVIDEILNQTQTCKN